MFIIPLKISRNDPHNLIIGSPIFLPAHSLNKVLFAVAHPKYCAS